MDWWTDLANTIRIDQVALAGLVTLTVILILRGILVPVQHLNDARKERDDWKKAYVESERARAVLVTQNGELLEVAKTANHVLRSLPGGDGRVVQTAAPANPGT